MGSGHLAGALAFVGLLCTGARAWSGTCEWLSVGNCVVISPSTDRAGSSDKCHVLRVQSFHSAGVRDMAANLAESILAASSDVPTLWNGGCVLPCLAFTELGSLVNQEEATFGGGAYYRVLREKLTSMTNVVDTASSFGRPMLQAVVFLDADVQVFAGWFSEVVRMSGLSSMSPDDVASRQQQARVLAKVPDSALGLDTRPGHGVYFQRESRKKLNSGVIFAHAINPSVRQGFLLANVSFMPRDYGDQTALQRAVNKIRRKNSACEDRPEEVCGLSVGMFNKSKVNAAVVDFQRGSVLIHHAHMSGRYKRQSLRLALKSKWNRTASLHSGRYLGVELVLPRCTPLRMDFSGTAPAAVEIVIAGILKSRPCPSVLSLGKPPTWPPTLPASTATSLRESAAGPISHDSGRYPTERPEVSRDTSNVAWVVLLCGPVVGLTLKRLCFGRRS